MPALAQTEVATQLGWLRNGEFAPVMVADAKGYFAEEGIKHRIMDGGPGKNPVSRSSGRARPTSGSRPAATTSSRPGCAQDPVDVIAVGTLLQVGPYSYITLANPGDPDPKPKDLEGKTVRDAVRRRDLPAGVREEERVDLSKVKVEIVQANAEPLLVGSVDFFTGWITNQPYLIEQEIAKPDAPPRPEGQGLEGDALRRLRRPQLLRRHLRHRARPIKEKPDLVKRYIRAAGSRRCSSSSTTPSESVEMVASFPEQIEKADKLAWRWKIQNPLFTSEDTKKNGLLWMNPTVWDQ